MYLGEGGSGTPLPLCQKNEYNNKNVKQQVRNFPSPHVHVRLFNQSTSIINIPIQDYCNGEAGD